MATPKLNVAIVGGGIAGLTLSIALSRLSDKKDIHVDLYETSSKFTELGAGFSVFRRPWSIIERLGLGQTLSRFTNLPSEEESIIVEMRKADQSYALQSPKYVLNMPYGNRLFHRVEFMQGLAMHIDTKTVSTHFNKRLLRYALNNAGGVDLFFKDGSSASCDVLLGADGIHSIVRGSLMTLAGEDAQAVGDYGRADLLSSMKEPVWSGSVAYRELIPVEKLRGLNPEHSALLKPQSFMGKNKHIITYPIKSRNVVNFVGFYTRPDKEGTRWEVRNSQESTQEELIAQYKGWEPEVGQLVQCIENPTLWAINTLRSLPICTHGPAALIGDAAHAMTPHQGSGAGQAIEDAYVLAALLTHPSTTRANVVQALKIYECIRLPFANNIMRLSRDNGRLYEFLAPDRLPHLDLSFDRPDDTVDVAHVDRVLKETHETMRKSWEWTWNSDPDDQRVEAIRLLEEQTIIG